MAALFLPARRMLARRFALYLDLIRWNRPAGWLLLLWPTLGALWFAADGWPGWHLLVVFTLGTFLMRSAGCCINDVADRDFDRHVKRTAQRPVTSGAASVKEALGLGAVLALAAFALVLTTNRADGAVVVRGAGHHAGLSVRQALVSIAAGGAGHCLQLRHSDGLCGHAVHGAVLVAWLLVGNLFWVLAYDTEYAMVDRDDDLKIGMKTSAITFGRLDVAAVMASYAIFLAIWGWAGASVTLGLPFYAGVAAAAQAAWHWRLITDRTRDGCFKAFRLNHWLGFTVFAGIVAGYALR
jgi:4-hydroxybenzoate polyprenyltransferase